MAQRNAELPPQPQRPQAPNKRQTPPFEASPCCVTPSSATPQSAATRTGGVRSAQDADTLLPSHIVKRWELMSPPPTQPHHKSPNSGTPGSAAHGNSARDSYQIGSPPPPTVPPQAAVSSPNLQRSVVDTPQGMDYWDCQLGAQAGESKGVHDFSIVTKLLRDEQRLKQTLLDIGQSIITKTNEINISPDMPSPPPAAGGSPAGAKERKNCGRDNPIDPNDALYCILSASLAVTQPTPREVSPNGGYDAPAVPANHENAPDVERSKSLRCVHYDPLVTECFRAESKLQQVRVPHPQKKAGSQAHMFEELMKREKPSKRRMIRSDTSAFSENAKENTSSREPRDREEQQTSPSQRRGAAMPTRCSDAPRAEKKRN